MKSILPTAACLVAIHLAAGCGPQRADNRSNPWEIHRAELAYDHPGHPAGKSTNAILLNSATGETLLLWTTSKSPTGYAWFELERLPSEAAQVGWPRDGY